ncbi:MAG TPA: 50S ribosomal protein L7Ae-like protein [Firmicutes bacterium]|jgi:large subunit ribosomal protein L7A|nr:50S ribosomal protein L7Ae-like protein [Bacillota bacterium]
MVPERLKSARRLSIGTKQSTKAVLRGEAKVVFVAQDADERVVKDLVQLCVEKGVEIVYVPSMRELGRACGIEVGAASVGLLS